MSTLLSSGLQPFNSLSQDLFERGLQESGRSYLATAGCLAAITLLGAAAIVMLARRATSTTTHSTTMRSPNAGGCVDHVDRQHQDHLTDQTANRTSPLKKIDPVDQADRCQVLLKKTHPVTYFATYDSAPSVKLASLKTKYSDPLKTSNRIRLQKFFGYNQKPKSNIKHIIMYMVEREQKGLQLLGALRSQGLITPQEYQTKLNRFKQAVTNSLADYFVISKRESNMIRRNPKKISNYVDRAINTCKQINRDESKKMVREVKAFFRSLHVQSKGVSGVSAFIDNSCDATNDAANKVICRSLQHEIIDSLLIDTAMLEGENGDPSMLSEKNAYGGKYAGLAKLSTFVNEANTPKPVLVPPFIGLTATDIESICQTGKLTYKMELFLDLFRDQPQARFMVRSSSAQEDQAGQSNAGCFETIANVKNHQEAFVDAIQQVYASFTSNNAKAQTALFNKGKTADVNSGQNNNGQNAEPPTSGDAIVIQLMMGETLGDDATIPASGVGLSPDPRSHAPGTFNINAALGHGEGVVQGRVATDETIGIIDSTTQAIHARTKVALQPERMAPVDEQHGLVMRENPKAQQRRPVLSDTAVVCYADILDRLTKAHPTGADMEFVVQGREGSEAGLFVVQQRSQDEARVVGDPNYLCESMMEANQSRAEKVSVKSYGCYGVTTIYANERIVADSLDDAFFDTYLDMKKAEKRQGRDAPAIKAVFVKPPVNPNSHAALMFRQQGISIVEVSHVEASHLLESSRPLVLDEQRGLIIHGMELGQNSVTKGLLSYPAEAVYSMLGEKSPLSQAQQLTLKSLIEIANHQTNGLASESTEQKTNGKVSSAEESTVQASTGQLMSDLKAEIIRGDTCDSSKAKRFIAQLLKKNHVIFSLAHRTDNPSLHRVAYEMTIDLIRLADAIENSANIMHQLLYHNWIEAAIHQMPEEHSDLVGVQSITSEFRERKAHQSFQTWFQAVALRHAGLQYRVQVTDKDRDPKSLSMEAKAAVRLLHRFSDGLVHPEIKSTWLSTLSQFVRRQDVSEDQLMTLAKRAIEWQQRGVMSSVVGDLLLPSSTSNSASSDTTLEPITMDRLLSGGTGINDTNDSLVVLKQMNSTLFQLKDSWSDPDEFEDRLAYLDSIVEPIKSSLDQLDASSPFKSITTLKEIAKVTEQLDVALKSIVTSRDYDERFRVFHFKQLITKVKAISMPLLNAAYAVGPYSNNLNNETSLMFQKGFVQLFDRVMESSGGASLYPSKDFVVSAAVIPRVVNSIYTAIPFTLGDLHTLLHQNTRMALGKITLDNNALQCLPSRALEIHHQLKQQLLPKLRNIPGTSGSRIEPTSMTQTEKGFQWYYALPLRDHGVRVCIDLDAKTQNLNIAIALDGKSENRRYEIAVNKIEEAKLPPFAIDSLRSGRALWPESETSHDNVIGWSERDSGDPHQIAERLASALAQITKISFQFADGEFDSLTNKKLGSPRKRIEAMYELLSPKNSSELIAYVEKGDINGLTDFLYCRLQSSSLKVATKCPNLCLENRITKKDLKNQLIELGVMERKIGFYEFDEILHARYGNDKIKREIAYNHLDLFWTLTKKQYDSLTKMYASLPDRWANSDFMNRLIPYLPDVASLASHPIRDDFSAVIRTIKHLICANTDEAIIKKTVEFLLEAPESKILALGELITTHPTENLRLMVSRQSFIFNLSQARLHLIGDFLSANADRKKDSKELALIVEHIHLLTHLDDFKPGNQLDLKTPDFSRALETLENLHQGQAPKQVVGMTMSLLGRCSGEYKDRFNAMNALINSRLDKGDLPGLSLIADKSIDLLYCLEVEHIQQLAEIDQLSSNDFVEAKV